MRRTKATLIYNCRFQSELVGPREIANFLVDLLLQTQSSCPPVTAARQPDFCVGFAAESHDLLAHATAKRLRKNVPLLVGNIGPATFGQDDNALLLVDANGAREIPRNDKLALARLLVADIAKRLVKQSD